MRTGGESAFSQERILSFKSRGKIEPNFSLGFILPYLNNFTFLRRTGSLLLPIHQSGLGHQ